LVTPWLAPAPNVEALAANLEPRVQLDAVYRQASLDKSFRAGRDPRQELTAEKGYPGSPWRNVKDIQEACAFRFRRAIEDGFEVAHEQQCLGPTRCRFDVLSRSSG